MRAYGADVIQQATDILGMCQQSVSTAKTIFQRLLSKVSLVELDVRLAALTVTLIAHKMHENRWTTPLDAIVQAFTQVLASRGETLHSLSSRGVKQQLFAAEVQVLELLSFSVGGTVTLHEKVVDVVRTLPTSQDPSAILRQAELLAAASLKTKLPAACTSETLAVGVVYVAGQQLCSPLPADLLPSLNVSEQEVLLIAHELSTMQTIQSPRFIDFQKRLEGTPPSDQSSSGTWRGLVPHAAKSQDPFWRSSAAPGYFNAQPSVLKGLFGADDPDIKRSVSRSLSPALMQGPQRVTSRHAASPGFFSERHFSVQQEGHPPQQVAAQGSKARFGSYQDLPAVQTLTHTAAPMLPKTCATMTDRRTTHTAGTGQGLPSTGRLAAKSAGHHEVDKRPFSRRHAACSLTRPGSFDRRARQTEVDCSRGGERLQRKDIPALSPGKDTKRLRTSERHSREWSSTCSGRKLPAVQEGRNHRHTHSSNSGPRESRYASEWRLRETRPAYVRSHTAGGEARQEAGKFEGRSSSKRSRIDSFGQDQSHMYRDHASKHRRYGH